MDVAAGTGLVEILVAAGTLIGVRLHERANRGTGVYEVQTDLGLWRADDDGSVISYDAKRGTRVRPQTRFTTWEELEAQDRAEEKVMGPKMKKLELRALEIEQPSGRKLYLVGMDVKQVHRIATVSRVKREGGRLMGYQRTEQVQHIANIREYLESADAMVPNAVVLGFNSTVRFHATDDGSDAAGRSGFLYVPMLNEDADPALLPGFIIDGQQRCAAGREADVESFVLPAVAFIDDDVRVQMDQFLRVNSVKPLPKALVTELLPATQGVLPPKLHSRRMPAALMERLNQDADSPLRGLIITLTNPRRTGKTPAKWGSFTALIADNSVIRSLENSINDGVLYQLLQAQGEGSEEVDMKPALDVLKRWWGVVRDVFPDAWGKDPKESRLSHGAGIVTLGLMLDGICSLTRSTSPSTEVMRAELELVADACCWTSGTWDLGPKPSDKRPWNEVQNVSKDVAKLASWLTTTYMARRRALAPDGEPLPTRPASPSNSKKRARGA